MTDEIELDVTDLAASMDDVHEAYVDGYNDALDFAIVLVKAAAKQCRKGGELRHAEVQNLLKSLEAVSKQV